jgi:hypothetical protein
MNACGAIGAQHEGACTPAIAANAAAAPSHNAASLLAADAGMGEASLPVAPAHALMNLTLREYKHTG